MALHHMIGYDDDHCHCPMHQGGHTRLESPPICGGKINTVVARPTWAGGCNISPDIDRSRGWPPQALPYCFRLCMLNRQYLWQKEHSPCVPDHCSGTCNIVPHHMHIRHHSNTLETAVVGKDEGYKSENHPFTAMDGCCQIQWCDSNTLKSIMLQIRAMLLRPIL